MNFFDINKFSIRREVVKRFLETDLSKQTTSGEKTLCLRFLRRDGDKVTYGSDKVYLILKQIIKLKIKGIEGFIILL